MYAIGVTIWIAGGAGDDANRAETLTVLGRVGGGRGRALLLEPVDQRADETDDAVPIGAGECDAHHRDAEERPEQDEEDEALTFWDAEVLDAALRRRPVARRIPVERVGAGGRHEHM